MALICILPLISGEGLDLSQWLRSPRQLSEGDGVALGLVSALQKWATSLEADSSSLKQDMDKFTQANTKLVDEVRLIRSQNVNLKNEVTQANERSQNIKSLYQKMGEQFSEIEKENKELKTAFQVCYIKIFAQQYVYSLTLLCLPLISASDRFFSFQSQLTVIKAQQDRIESNNDVINKMKTDLSTASGNLKKLKGKDIIAMFNNIAFRRHDLSNEHTKQALHIALNFCIWHDCCMLYQVMMAL